MFVYMCIYVEKQKEKMIFWTLYALDTSQCKTEVIDFLRRNPQRLHGHDVWCTCECKGNNVLYVPYIV